MQIDNFRWMGNPKVRGLDITEILLLQGLQQHPPPDYNYLNQADLMKVSISTLRLKHYNLIEAIMKVLWFYFFHSDIRSEFIIHMTMSWCSCAAIDISPE
jgi:hypothetical protein